jgi:hypothetical protein
MLSALREQPSSIEPRAHESACIALYNLGEHLVCADDYERETGRKPRRIFFWKKPTPPDPDRRQTFALCHDLADALRDLGKHTESSMLHEAILTESEKHLGIADPDTLACRQCLDAMSALRRSEIVRSSVGGSAT